MKFDLNLAGHVFGSLTVLELHDKDRNNQTRWRCQCACGYQPVIRRNDLVRGKSKSCGCSKKNNGRRRTVSEVSNEI